MKDDLNRLQLISCGWNSHSTHFLQNYWILLKLHYSDPFKNQTNREEKTKRIFFKSFQKDIFFTELQALS